MNSDLEHLIVLQAEDLELSRLRGELLEAPRRVIAAAKALASAEQRLSTCRAGLLAEEKLRRGKEMEAAGMRTKLARLRRSLDTATSAQQVGAFENEIGFTEAAIGTLEDEELGSMERAERLETEQTAAEISSQQAAAALAQERERGAALKAEHEAKIAGIDRERLGLRQQIAAGPLALYDRLTKTRGTAIAEAIGTAVSGKCAACQMGVRPQRWQDLTGRDHLDEIFACESCGRLLFWDPRRDTPKSWAAGERLQAAQSRQPSPGAAAGGTR